MEIKIVRIYLTGGRRINELFEEGEKKSAKIREMKKAVEAQDRQMKGWGKDFEILLTQIEVLKAKNRTMEEDRDEWVRRYLESEKARKSLGEKLKEALNNQVRPQEGGAQA